MEFRDSVWTWAWEGQSSCGRAVCSTVVPAHGSTCYIKHAQIVIRKKLPLTRITMYKQYWRWRAWTNYLQVGHRWLCRLLECSDRTCSWQHYMYPSTLKTSNSKTRMSLPAWQWGRNLQQTSQTTCRCTWHRAEDLTAIHDYCTTIHTLITRDTKL